MARRFGAAIFVSVLLAVGVSSTFATDVASSDKRLPQQPPARTAAFAVVAVADILTPVPREAWGGLALMGGLAAWRYFRDRSGT